MYSTLKKKKILLLLRLGFSTLKSYGQKRDASWDSTFSVKNFVLFFFSFLRKSFLVINLTGDHTFFLRVN